MAQQAATQQPSRDCPCCGSKIQNPNTQAFPWASGDLHATVNGTWLTARFDQNVSPYFAYTTDGTCCPECMGFFTKSGKWVSVGLNRLGGQEALTMAYQDTWMPGGAGGVFSCLPQVNLSSPPRVYSDLGTVGFDASSNPKAQLPIAGVQGTTYFTTYDEIGGVYYEYFAGSTLSTSDPRFGRINRRYDTDGNVIQYNYKNNAGGKALLRCLTGDITGNLVPYLYYANETIDASHFAPITQISLLDQVTPGNTRTAYFTYQNYVDSNSKTRPYFSKIVNPTGCTTLYDPIVPFASSGDAYQIFHEVDPLGYGTYFAYNGALSEIIQVTEAEGRVTYYSYPSASETVQTQNGRNSRFVFYALNATGDQLTQVTQHTDPLGNTTYFGYDQTLARMLQKIDPNGNLSYYEYVGGGKPNQFALTRQVSAFNLAQTYFGYSPNAYDLVKKVGPRWQSGTTIEVTYYQYDTTRNRVLMVDAVGNTTYYGHDSVGRSVKVFDPRKNTTYYNYGSTTGALNSTVDALGNVTYYGYNSFLNKTASVSPRWTEKNSFASFTTYYVYDQLDRKTKTIDPQLNVTYYDWDSRGDMLDTVDALNTVTAYTYNGLRLKTQTQVTNSAGTLLTQTKNAYDQYKNRIRTQDGNGNLTYFFYDQIDRPIATLDALLNPTYFYFDSVNNRTAGTDPRGNATYFFYDQISRNTATRDAQGNYTYFFYDLSNNKTVQVDALQFASYFFYDALDRSQAIRDALGNPTYFFYDPDSNRCLQMDARFNSSYFGYDALNRRSQMMDALGNATYYLYDAKGNRTKIIDARLNSTYLFYDTLNRTSVRADALFNPTYFFYDAVSNLTQVIDARFNTTYYFFDGLHRASRMRDALGDPTYFFFDLAGNRTVQMDARFNSTYFGYDKLNRQTQRQDSLGNISYYFYDPVGNRTQVVDARGNASNVGYDTLNRQASVGDPIGNATLLGYDAVGNVTAMDRGVLGWNLAPYGTSPYGGADGVTTYFYYDGLRRTTGVRDPLGNSTYYFYDPVSNRTVLRNPLGHATYFGYDTLNRLVKSQDTLGNATYFTFDGVSNRTQVTDADNRTTYFKYDVLNRTSAILFPDAGSTYYLYDPVSNRTCDLDPLAKPTYYGYDALNRPLRIQDALNQTLYFQYDAVGNVSSFLDGERASSTFTYDAINRRTNITYAAGGAVVLAGVRSNPYYSYDPVSNLTQMGDIWGLHRMGYDAGNRLTQHQFPNGNVVYFRYDPRWNVTARVYPGSSGTSGAAYDSDDRQTLVQAPSGATAYFAYDAASNLTQRLLGNSVKLTATYDTVERVSQWRYSDKNGGSLSYFDYTRDSKGLITKAVREANFTLYYTYDPNDRLAMEVWAKTGSTPSEVYGYRYKYDLVGNRTQALINGSATYYSYDIANQLKVKGTTSAFASPTYYLYDKNGSLVNQVSASTLTYFAYNPAGMVARILWTDATATYFFYDGNLQRYSMVANGTPTYFLWDGPNFLQQLNASGTVLEEYTNAKSPTAGIAQLVETNRPGQMQQKIYPVVDPRGSITKYIQSDGATIFSSREEDSFGTIIPNSQTGSAWPGIFGFQGQSWMEIASGLGAQRLLLSPSRIYDPIDGRFVSRDPLRLADPTAMPGRIQPRYLYVQNNPVMFVDRNGMSLQNWQAGAWWMLGTDVVVGALWNQQNVLFIPGGPEFTNYLVYQFGNNMLGASGSGGVGFGAVGGLAGPSFVWTIAGGIPGLIRSGCTAVFKSGCCIDAPPNGLGTGFGFTIINGLTAGLKTKVVPMWLDITSAGLIGSWADLLSQGNYYYDGAFDLNVQVTPDSNTEDCQIQRYILGGMDVYKTQAGLVLRDPRKIEADGPVDAAGASPNSADSVWRDDPYIYVYDYPGLYFRDKLLSVRTNVSFKVYVFDKTDDTRRPSWISYDFTYEFTSPNNPTMNVKETGRYISPCT